MRLIAALAGEVPIPGLGCMAYSFSGFAVIVSVAGCGGGRFTFGRGIALTFVALRRVGIILLNVGRNSRSRFNVALLTRILDGLDDVLRRRIAEFILELARLPQGIEVELITLAG